jgi:restriction endonuclease Mrr
VVRELYGTVNMTNASAGILLTTSFFEPGAQAMERELRFRLKLADYMDLQEMLREPASRKSQLRTR